MWRVYCSDCEEVVLLDSSQLTSVVNLEPGVIAGHAMGEQAWKRSS